jgi:hemerythrin-like metal-binding protein
MSDTQASSLPAAKPFELPQSALFRYGSIDTEHRVLVDILNDTMAEFAAGGRPSGPRFAGHVTRLLAHLRAHFNNEEMAMAATRYPDLAGHKAHHLAMIARVAALRENALQQANLDKESVFELFDQVFDDLLRADLPFKSYLDANGLTDKA